MKNYINSKNEIYGYDDSQSGIVPQDYVLIPEKYIPDQYPFLSLVDGKIEFDSALYEAKQNEYLVLSYQGAAQNQLDNLAISWGYNSIISAASYSNSTNPQYKADADALISWRDAVWEKTYQVLSAKPLPSNVESFLAMLPAKPSKPIV